MTNRTYAKDVTDDEVALLMESSLSRLRASVRLAKTDQQRRPPNQEQTSKQEKAKAEQLDQSVINFLRSIYDRPLLSTTARRDDIGETSDGFGRLKRICLDRKLTEDFSVNLGSNAGGNVKQLALTERGYRALGKKPGSLPPANVSREHHFWQRHIHRYLEQDGHKAEIEKCLAGKCADIGLLKSDGWHAFEVVMSGSNNEVVNVKRNISSGFMSTAIGCRNKTVLRAVNIKLSAHLSDSQKQKVTVKLLSELWFVPRLVKEISGVGRGS